MRFHFYSPVNFELWDYRNPDTKGIGGSETSHIEMALRLAKSGHAVESYSPIPKGCPDSHGGVVWLAIKQALFWDPGVWVLYRCPSVLDNFSGCQKDQRIWFVAQDVSYKELTDERLCKIERIIALCPDHARFLAEQFPKHASKVWLSSNGIRRELIEGIESTEKIERNPNQLLFASSPDRGLVPLLKIFKKTREYLPELELKVAYGFHNLDLLVENYPYLKKIKSEVEALLNQPNVTFCGRLSQPDLMREWFKTSYWVHPTDFTETSCITAMESMACGAYPITRPLWALKDNVKFGTMIEGSPGTDALVQCRYVGEIIRAFKTGLADKVQAPMMKWARDHFDWNRFVDQWEKAAS